MKKVELSDSELHYLANILSEKISDYNDDLYHNENGKPFYFMPDGSISYDSYELNDLPVANDILKKLYTL